MFASPLRRIRVTWCNPGLDPGRAALHHGRSDRFSYSLTDDDGNIGLTASSAAITTVVFIFSTVRETATRIRDLPTRREIVPQWWRAAPSNGQARKRHRAGPRPTHAVVSRDNFSDVAIVNREFPAYGPTIDYQISDKFCKVIPTNFMPHTLLRGNMANIRVTSSGSLSAKR